MKKTDSPAPVVGRTKPTWRGLRLVDCGSEKKMQKHVDEQKDKEASRTQSGD